MAVSGRREGRPQLNALTAAARNQEIDCVLVWKFDRFARSTRHLLVALEESDHLGIRFVSVQDQVDTESPMGRAMFTIIGAMAEFESSLISERVTAGMRAAQVRGRHLGRPGRRRGVRPWNVRRRSGGGSVPVSSGRGPVHQLLGSGRRSDRLRQRAGNGGRGQQPDRQRLGCRASGRHRSRASGTPRTGQRCRSWAWRRPNGSVHRVRAVLARCQESSRHGSRPRPRAGDRDYAPRRSMDRRYAHQGGNLSDWTAGVPQTRRRSTILMQRAKHVTAFYTYPEPNPGMCHAKPTCK